MNPGERWRAADTEAAVGVWEVVSTNRVSDGLVRGLKEKSCLSTWKDGVAVPTPSLTSVFCLQFHCHFSSQAPLILITVIAFKQILQTSS